MAGPTLSELGITPPDGEPNPPNHGMRAAISILVAFSTIPIAILGAPPVPMAAVGLLATINAIRELRKTPEANPPPGR